MIVGESMTKEYSGTLMGGPHADMHVDASVNRIPVKVTTEMWLDGDEPDKDINKEVTSGYYVWAGGYFLWETFSQTWYKIKKED